MRIKIVHKLLIANLSIILILVLTMQAFNYISHKGALNSFIEDIENKALDNIANNLIVEYKKQQSFEHVSSSLLVWRKFALKHLKEFEHLFQGPFIDHHKPGPPRKHDDLKRPPRPDHIRPDKPPRRFADKPGKRDILIHRFVDRISLLDADKNQLISSRKKDSLIIERKIEFNNKTIGWLTLSKKDFKNNPMDNFYMAKQLEMNYLIGSLGVFIATLISYFLSRHITAPINAINQGAQKIAKRDFSTHIHVNTDDEFKTLANNVNNISKKLAQFDQQQKQWIMDISHELRTPLTILHGELDAIADGVIPLTSEAIVSLQEEVNLLMRLVNDLHQLTIIDNANLQCAQDDAELVALMHQQINKFNQKFANKNISLIEQLPESELKILGDYDRLSQVIQNILENGLRYIASPGTLTVSAKVSSQIVQLSFEDTGPGVPETALPYLFDRLYRTDESRNRKTGGAGLGLAICKNIILAHHGEIDAKLNEKGGLSIIIKLPLNR